MEREESFFPGTRDRGGKDFVLLQDPWIRPSSKSVTVSSPRTVSPLFSIVSVPKLETTATRLRLSKIPRGQSVVPSWNFRGAAGQPIDNRRHQPLSYRRSYRRYWPDYKDPFTECIYIYDVVWRRFKIDPASVTQWNTPITNANSLRVTCRI